MRLRPEQWVLLGILAVALVLLVVQVGHNVAFPSLRRPSAAAPAAATPVGSALGSSAAGAAGGLPGSDSATPVPGGGSAPPVEASAAQTAPLAAASTASGGLPPEPPPPGPDSPALGVRLEPASTLVQQPIVAFITLEGATQAAEVFFDLRYDPEILAFDAGSSGALDALASGGELPEMKFQVPEPGRLVAQARRRSGQPVESAGGDLCAIQFSAKRSGSTPLRLVRAGVRNAHGDLIGARGAETMAEVR